MVELVLRLAVSLAVVLGLIWCIARMSGRRLGASGSLLGVVGRQSVGRNASVQVVSVGGRLLVVGVSEQQVTLLTELDVDALDDPSAIETVATHTAHSAAPDTDAAPATARQTVPGTVVARGQHAARQRPARRPGGARVARPTRSGGTTAASGTGRVDGSLLSPGTWRDAWTAVTRGSAA